MPKGGKPLHVVSLDQLLGYMSEQFGRLDEKLDNMSKDFIIRRELDVVQKDVDRAHEKYRILEARLQASEIADAGDRGEAKGRFTMTEKIGGAILALLLAAAMAGLGLR